MVQQEVARFTKANLDFKQRGSQNVYCGIQNLIRLWATCFTKSGTTLGWYGSDVYEDVSRHLPNLPDLNVGKGLPLLYASLEEEVVCLAWGSPRLVPLIIEKHTIF